MAGKWTWSCGAASCQANVTSPTIHAGCAVQSCLNENCEPDSLAPADEFSSSCSSNGQRLSGTQPFISASVGTVTIDPITPVGNQRLWAFTTFDEGRFNIQWGGDLEPYRHPGWLATSTSECIGLTKTFTYGIIPNCYSGAVFQAPDGTYSNNVTVTDTYNGSVVTLTINAVRNLSTVSGGVPP
jgi:hypothetical protein